jgi:hypothetical protein
VPFTGTKAPPPIRYFVALVSRARSQASHHILISSNGTTAQNRYGIGTSIFRRCGDLSGRSRKRPPLSPISSAIKRGTRAAVPAAKDRAGFDAIARGFGNH